MSKLKVTYFDFARSRGEEVRLALNLAGIAFEDNRIDFEAFGKIKSDLPFASLPILEIEGKGIFGQSNAILRLIGRQHGLHPNVPFEAARDDALMDAAEDLRVRISQATRMKDEGQKKEAKQNLASGYIPQWAQGIERQIGDGPFVGGSKPSVVDIKLYMVHNWLSGGGVDDIPVDILDPYPKLAAVASGIKNHPAVQAWYAKSR